MSSFFALEQRRVTAAVVPRLGLSAIGERFGSSCWHEANSFAQTEGPLS